MTGTILTDLGNGIETLAADIAGCTACEAAARNPHSGRYNANCDACTVRAVALSPQFYAAERAGQMTPNYRALLEKVFGSDKWREAHERVKAWRSRRGQSA